MSAYKNDYESIRKIFWDGIVDEKQYFWDDDGIKMAIRRAIVDLTVRTMTRRSDIPESERIENRDYCEEICKNGFLDKIKEWFNSNQNSTEEEFDNWHKEACETVIDFLKTQYIEADATYGKAQKIINMTLKNLYCLEGAKEYDEKNKFDFCHMALDSFTLEWFWRNCANYAGCCRKNSRVDKKIYKGMIGSWSRIQNSEGKDTFTVTVKEENKQVEREFYTYDFFVKVIRDYFYDFSKNVYNGLMPFKAEFYIWPEIQLHLAAEAVIFQLKEDYLEDDEEQLPENERKKKIDAKKKELKDLPIKDKLTKMKDEVDKHLKALEIDLP